MLFKRSEWDPAVRTQRSSDRSVEERVWDERCDIDDSFTFFSRKLEDTDGGCTYPTLTGGGGAYPHQRPQDPVATCLVDADVHTLR